MTEEKLKFSAGTISMLRMMFTKGMYYGDEEALVKCAEAMTKISNIPKIIESIRQMREKILERDFKKQERHDGLNGRLYFTSVQFQSINKRILELSTSIDMQKREIINFIIENMEREGILIKEFNLQKVKKLPLIAREKPEERYETYQIGI